MTPRTYPRETPALDAPPQPAFMTCACGVLLLARVWHNRTEEEPAHWEVLTPPVTPVWGRLHTCGMLEVLG